MRSRAERAEFTVVPRKLACLRPLIPAAIFGLPLFLVGLVDLVVFGEIDFATLTDVGTAVLGLGLLRATWWALTVGTAVLGAGDTGVTYGRLLKHARTVPWDGLSSLRVRRGVKRPEWHLDPGFTEIEVDLTDGRTVTFGKYLWIDQTDSAPVAEFTRQCLRHGVGVRIT